MMHTIDLPHASQIASEITFACMELRWQAGSDCNGCGGGGVHCSQFLTINGLLSLTARITHLSQAQMQRINNVGASCL